MTSDRQLLRNELRHKRNQLSDTQQAEAAIALLKQFQLTFSLSKNANIALYLSNDAEISPAEICQWCWNNDLSVYLPVLNGKSLVFARYHPDSQWQENRFGILEPKDEQPVQGHDLDLVLMPLVGFDYKGDRLGMGGGFYDRTFEHKAATTKLIGLAHDCQEVASLPTASWDVPLSGILTPSRFIDCSR